MMPLADAVIHAADGYVRVMKKMGFLRMLIRVMSLVSERTDHLRLLPTE
jgi:hypothetical protein